MPRNSVALGFPVPRAAPAGAASFSLGGTERSCQRGVGGTGPPGPPSLSQRGSEPSGWVPRASHLLPGRKASWLALLQGPRGFPRLPTGTLGGRGRLCVSLCFLRHFQELEWKVAASPARSGVEQKQRPL